RGVLGWSSGALVAGRGIGADARLTGYRAMGVPHVEVPTESNVCGVEDSAGEPWPDASWPPPAAFRQRARRGGARRGPGRRLTARKLVEEALRGQHRQGARGDRVGGEPALDAAVPEPAS